MLYCIGCLSERVPHVDVEIVLECYLADQVRSTYMQKPQPGFQGCYATQRCIKAAVSMKDLPYFIPVKYEGVTYHTCLFVPGWEPVCFKYNHIGHMRSQCPGPVQSIPPVIPNTDDVEADEGEDDESNQEPAEPAEPVEFEMTHAEASKPVGNIKYRLVIKKG